MKTIARLGIVLLALGLWSSSLEANSIRDWLKKIDWQQKLQELQEQRDDWCKDVTLEWLKKHDGVELGEGQLREKFLQHCEIKLQDPPKELRLLLANKEEMLAKFKVVFTDCAQGEHPPENRVPDGGATLILLGLGAVAVGLANRRKVS